MNILPPTSATADNFPISNKALTGSVTTIPTSSCVVWIPFPLKNLVSNQTLCGSFEAQVWLVMIRLVKTFHGYALAQLHKQLSPLSLTIASYTGWIISPQRIKCGYHSHYQTSEVPQCWEHSKEYLRSATNIKPAVSSSSSLPAPPA